MQVPAPWQKISSKLVHDHLLKVESHHVRNSAGHEFTVPVVRCPGSAVVLAITADDQVAVVRQHRYAADVLTWELPGGVVDDEHSPEQAAIQELHEEAQLRPGELFSLGEVMPYPSLTDETLYQFVATGCTHDPDAGPDDECVVDFVDFDRVMEMVVNNQFPPYAATIVLRYARETGR